MVLTMAVAPALHRTALVSPINHLIWSVGFHATYKTPMLIARATPTFSFRFIWSFQMTFHGKSANTKSIMPE